MQKTPKHITALNGLRACSSAVKYASQFPTLQKAWDACERGDWMLWLVGKQITSKPWSDDRKPLLACALDCAETVSHLWGAETKRSVDVLRKWIAGDATVKEAQEARRSLYAASAAAADAAYAAAAAAAAYAAADAAYAAYAAAAAAAAAAAYADADAARKRNQKQTADIVRRHYPKAPRLSAA